MHTITCLVIVLLILRPSPLLAFISLFLLPINSVTFELPLPFREHNYLMSQHTVTINVASRKLKVACPKGQETALLSAAQEVTDRLASTNKKNTATNTPEQALLMTALNLANDLLALRKEHEKEQAQAQSKIELLQDTIEQALGDKHSRSA